MISIGAVFGGGELSDSRIDREISNMRFPEKDTGLPMSLNVVFHVPGSIIGLDWAGVRTGRFSKKEKMLMVQVAVPEEVKQSADIRSFLFASLRNAVLVAAPFFQKKGIEFPAERYLALIGEAQG